MLGFRRLFSSGRTPKSSHIPPPAHFSNHLPNISHPPTHFGNPSSPTNNSSTGLQNHRPAINNGKPVRELSVLLTMMVLSYLAIDNYWNRVKLEKLLNETTIINIKTLKLQQANYTTAQKRKNLLVIGERRENNKKFTKMGVHIALLRKQLIDLGHNPVDIDSALKEYEKTVKVNTSVNNVTDQILYIGDQSGTLRIRICSTSPNTY